MEILEDLMEGLEGTGFVIRDGVRLTKNFDQPLRLL
jgi:hypothetical protein